MTTGKNWQDISPSTFPYQPLVQCTAATSLSRHFTDALASLDLQFVRSQEKALSW
ncbi:hypothetical protein KDA_14510 [Dictyobacter alpinus]|uniref:Uncharacterized protein n=1 Tax=Dictyobacter alpinus TaxID=2014873 RepID=A0A402B3T5_9CHLR|nr:hypothetical protein [Dictyobacter alpinus]GCE25967.1 hypothetical protein KDA_14510 [Dictyobacter alpinus]